MLPKGLTTAPPPRRRDSAAPVLTPTEPRSSGQYPAPSRQDSWGWAAPVLCAPVWNGAWGWALGPMSRLCMGSQDSPTIPAGESHSAYAPPICTVREGSLCSADGAQARPNTARLLGLQGSWAPVTWRSSLRDMRQMGVPDRCSQVLPGARLVSIPLAIRAMPLGARGAHDSSSLCRPPGGPLPAETCPGTSGESHLMPTHRCSFCVSRAEDAPCLGLRQTAVSG